MTTGPGGATGPGGTRHAVTVAHFRVFERGAAGGNPCPVIGDAAGLSGGDMQRLAAHLGEESGFVLHDDGGGLRFRFFMPRREVPMCVHATVAAITWLVASGMVPRAGELPVRTASGQCRVSWDDQSPPRVTVEQQRPNFGVPASVGADVERVLGLEPGTVDQAHPIRSVSVSAPKLIVPLRTASDVHRVNPDVDRLQELCERLETTGVYVFAPHPDGNATHVVARQFPVGGGIREDPATGVAAGALAAYLAQRAGLPGPTWSAIEIDQGDAIGCPCRLEAASYTEAGQVLRTTVTGRASITGSQRVDLSVLGAGDP
jgi:PhzF family phenazine biosynthesis protein